MKLKLAKVKTKYFLDREMLQNFANENWKIHKRKNVYASPLSCFRSRGKNKMFEVSTMGLFGLPRGQKNF